MIKKSIIITKIRFVVIKVLIIVDDYLPSNKPASTMMHQLAYEFLTNNHDVTVISPSSELSQNYVREKIDGIDVYKFKSGKIKKTSRVKRAINESLLSVRAWFSLRNFFLENKHDYIIYYSPSIFFGPLVWKLKKIWKVKSFLILRDIFPRWAIDNKMIREYSVISLYFKFFERINYINANTIGLMSPKNLEFFEKNYKVKNKKIVLNNWISRFKSQGSKKDYKDIFNLKNKVVFFYGGNIGKAQDISSIVKLANKMRDISDAHFFIVGDGDNFSDIEKEIFHFNLKNITLLKTVEKDEYYQMLKQFDVGIFTLSSSHKTHNFPGKILEYLNFEKPILGLVNNGNDIKNLIEFYNVGYISFSENFNEFFSNANKLINHRERNTLKKNINRILDETFSSNSAYKKIIKFSK